MRPGRATRTLAALSISLALGGCGLVGPSVVALPAAGGPADAVPPPGPVDTRLLALDPNAILQSVDGGKACRQGLLQGARGSDEGQLLLFDFTCPRAGQDRNVYFLFAEALEAALKETGAEIPSAGSAVGDGDAPLVTDWFLRGQTRVGVARVLGENEPGILRLFVSIDIFAP
ncbi:MAG TPA: hypothetical protein VES19_05925 [Candidatus Limnocylindrales bacterium]|nr:hypothetical protein [Candidatus Limnocylindrales bacterium]